MNLNDNELNTENTAEATLKIENGFIYPFLMVLLVLAVSAFIFSMTYKGKISDADINTVTEEVLSVMNTDAISLADDTLVKRLYGLDPADFEGLIFYAPVTNMDAEELIIVKLADTAQRDTVEAALQKRLASQLSVFDGYGAEQTDMLNKSHVYVSGNYAIFVSSVNPDEALAIFRRCL